MRSAPRVRAADANRRDRDASAGDLPGATAARVLATHWEAHAGRGGSIEEIESLARGAISLLEEAGDHLGLAYARYVLGSQVYNSRLEYENWIQAIEQMILHSRVVRSRSLFGLCQALVFGPHPTDEALRALESYLQDEPRPTSVLWRAVLLAMLGRADEARQEAGTAYRRLEELAGGSNPGLSTLSLTEALVGDLDAAVDHLRAYCDSLASRGQVNLLSTFAPVLGRWLCDLGRYDEAEPLAFQGRDLGADDDVITQVLWRQVLARVLADRGKYVEAKRLAREAIALLEPIDVLNLKADAFSDLAEVLEQAGKSDDALAALNQALALYEQKKNLAMVAQISPWLERLSSGAATRAISD